MSDRAETTDACGSRPFVSVIIPVYNDTARLQRCLECLAAQTYWGERWEAIVVDNGSQASPREIVERFPFCRFVEEPTPGSYAARNRGLKLARGEMIAFTDSDCLPTADWLMEGVKAVGSVDALRFVGGRIEIFPLDSHRPTAVELYDMSFGLNQKLNVERLDHAATANMFALAALFSSVGEFDASVKSGGDLEWGKRATSQGILAVFSDTAVVRHPARRRYAELLRQARRHAGGQFDRRQGRSERRGMLHTLRVLARTVLPNVPKMWRARRELRERGYGTIAWLRTIPVILVVQYARLWEVVRKYCGFSSERR